MTIYCDINELQELHLKLENHLQDENTLRVKLLEIMEQVTSSFQPYNLTISDTIYKDLDIKLLLEIYISGILYKNKINKFKLMVNHKPYKKPTFPFYISVPSVGNYLISFYPMLFAITETYLNMYVSFPKQDEPIIINIRDVVKYIFYIYDNTIILPSCTALNMFSSGKLVEFIILTFIQKGKKTEYKFLKKLSFSECLIYLSVKFPMHYRVLYQTLRQTPNFQEKTLIKTFWTNFTFNIPQ